MTSLPIGARRALPRRLEGVGKVLIPLPAAGRTSGRHWPRVPDQAGCVYPRQRHRGRRLRCWARHGSETERALEPCARAAFRLHLSTRIYALNWYRTDNVQPVACDLLAERRICDLVDARAEEAYAPPNQAAICWQAGKQEQGSQN
jgi:hypothetical protein